MTVTIDTIRAAAKAIEGRVIRTPLLMSKTLSDITGAEVWVKFENFQFTAAFKERGALNKLLTLTEAECRNGVIAMSAGNHAPIMPRALGFPQRSLCRWRRHSPR
jgi:threonine dehydratase